MEVYISYQKDHDRKRFPLHLKWPESKIDSNNSKLLSRSKKDPDVNDYNMIIMSERSKMNEIAKLYRLSNRILTCELLKREIFYFDPSQSVIGYFKKRRRELFKLRVISENTWKNYGSTINELENFRPTIRWEQITYNFMQEFKAWLKKKKKRNGMVLAHNTIWTRFKDLKAFLAVADQEVQVYIPKEVIEFPNTYREEESTYLNKDEVIRLIQQLDQDSLSTNQFNVLKAFLFCCFSGIRISDLYNSKYSWMISDNFMKFTMQKNSERNPKTITVPLIPIAKIFINSTGNTLFQLPSTQEYNRTLKELAGFAGIKKVLTSHVARHTFGYLIMKYVGDIYLLKKLLGHSKIATTEKYAHNDDDNNYEKTLQIQGDFEGLWKVRNAEIIQC
ncbi:site-specific integrase [Sphingobacterium kyonggiense]|uniref:Site-specific integrase n=1 Tax=Sphingobacterium kyonggiense TaxID=714075 RepID=A0ABP7YLQ8_9SPHI